MIQPKLRSLVMSWPAILLLTAFLLCYLCDGASSRATGSASQGRPIRFASFNIQVFGRKKASDKVVMDTLARILMRYDIVVIMEIRDSSGEAFPQLVSRTNRDLLGDPFAFVISERTGRTVSKEQYAVLYRRSVASVLNERTLPDPGDRFQREPYLVKLALGSPQRRRSPNSVPLTVLCLHTEPEQAVAELNALDDAVQPMKAENFLIAGDLNADCSYVTRTEMASLKLRQDASLHWLIGDSVDTTVKSTNCAYDRLIASDAALHMLSSPRVFLFDREFGLSADEAARVSDHYPVELDITV